MMKGNDGGETTTRPYYSTIRYAKKNANPSSKQNQKFGGQPPKNSMVHPQSSQGLGT